MLLTASANQHILVYQSSTKSVTLRTEKTRASGLEKDRLQLSVLI